MGAVISLLIILSLSLLITRIAAIILSLTGLSKEAASFQARSAFTGVGFTTSESEWLVDHPVRRKIIKTLMLIGNVGIVSGMGSLVLSFLDVDQQEVSKLLRLGIILAAILLMWLLSRSDFLEKQLYKLVVYFLKKYSSIKVYDYNHILNLKGPYEISELKVDEGSWLANESLRNLRLNDEGVTILSIRRSDGNYMGVPDADTKIERGDRLVVYGREDNLKELSKRKDGLKGEEARNEAKEKQEEVKEEQEEQEEKRKESS